MASHSRRFAESGQDSTGLRSNSEGVRGTTERSAQRLGLRKAPNESSLTCSSQNRPPSFDRLTSLSEYGKSGQIHACHVGCSVPTLGTAIGSIQNFRPEHLL